VRELLRYSRRVQIAAVASSFNYEIDSLLVALLFPVRFVAYYSIGTNFSNQLIALPTNAITPIGVALSRTFGRSTLKETVDEFTRLQRLWVRSVAAFPLIGAATAYFAIDRWLGHADHLAGVVAAILLIGQTTSLLGLVMDNFGKSVNRPDLESRYLGVGVAVNLAVTIPLALTIGMLGVPAGTAIGMVISSAYFLHVARRELSPDLRSFVADIPKVALGLSVCVTLLLELPAFAIAPTGVLGLLVCAVPAGVGLGVYGLASTVRRARPVIPSQ
jgi:O-antigen/teichoic acid export membrane protein